MKSRTLKADLSKLATEQQNPSTLNLDTMSAFEIAHAINHEDQNVPKAVEKQLPQIAKAIELVAESSRQRRPPDLRRGWN